MMNKDTLIEQYLGVRQHTETICGNLKTEDYVVQPAPEVSPPKWHLGHTAWFFETFILKPSFPGYQPFNDQFDFVFNSYYESLGARVVRTDRGNLSRPTVNEVYDYRRHVDENMIRLLQENGLSNKMLELITLGLNHEQQHQELLATDIKFILGHNPLLPPYSGRVFQEAGLRDAQTFVRHDAGIYEIGFQGEGFCFDNELRPHKVYLEPFEMAYNPVSKGEFLEFILDRGYQDFRHWHSEGWAWVQQTHAQAPLYWHNVDGIWMNYTFDGMREVNGQEVLCHVNYYEAAAFAAWKGMRLPLESEWEVAADAINWGQCWEWTGSAYLPYPGYERSPGALGEYNGKFMVNQMVLRGASMATPKGHSRKTYRNFFHACEQWQFSGIRVCRNA